jgi:ribosomal protein S12 methylthiotransferase
MNRKGDLNTYLRLIENIRAEIPDIAIRSTFMTGFPGEDDRAFDELLSFVEASRLDRVGCFAYSPEEGTAAADHDDVPSEIKESRLNKLMDIQSRISAEKLEEKIGTRVRVLIEGKEDDGTFTGRTEYDAPEVDGIFYLTADDAAIHDIVVAEVTDSIDHDLSGVI